MMPRRNNHRVNRGQGSTGKWLFLLFAAIAPSLVTAETSVGRQFANTDDYAECVANLHTSDEDDNLEVNTEEYLTFLALQSDNQLVYDEYLDVPLALTSNFIFTACSCSFFGGAPDCCVGEKAHIALDAKDSPIVSSNIITFCMTIARSIAGELPPTMAPIPTESPTMEPTVPITESPSAGPTLAPTPSPSDSPSASPSVSPSDSPSAAPSASPSQPPTSSPSASPSNAPTMTPTPAPSAAPTAPDDTPAPTIDATPAPSTSPSSLPSVSPTSSPSSSPSGSPSSIPSSAPSSSPTMVPSSSPSSAPTGVPSSTPTTSEPSMSPTPFALTCVNFQYGISNDDGFTAEDIFNEVNNTFKTGLLIATENVTIETLTEAYPPDDDLSPSLTTSSSTCEDTTASFIYNDKAKDCAWVARQISRCDQTIDNGTPIDTLCPVTCYVCPGRRVLSQVDTRHKFGSKLVNHERLRILTLEESGWPVASVWEEQVERRTAYVPGHTNGSSAQGTSDTVSRELAVFDERFPPQIPAIVDNPFCRKPVPERECAIVSSIACALLEEGDDREEVRATLLNGIRDAIMDGSFEAAIPPEHQL